MKNDTSLSRVVGVVRTTMWWTLLVSAGINLLMLVSPIYMMQIYDRVIATRHFDTLIYLTIMAVVALLVMALFDYVRGLVGHRLAAWMDACLAGETVAATVRAAHLSGVGGNVQGLRDLATLRGLIANGALWPVLDAPWMPVFFAAIYLIHPVLFWVSLLGGAVLILLALANVYLAGGAIKKAATESIMATGAADAAVRNADSMIGMGILPHFINRWLAANDAASAPQVEAGERSAAISAAAKFVRMGLQMMILGVGAYLVIRGEITAGTMIAASILMARAVAPLEQGIGTWRILANGQIAYNRLTKLLAEAGRNPDTIRLPRPAGALSVEGVSYAVAHSREPILRQVSFAVAPGECVGVIGPSGSGKTTLLRVIVGSLNPQAGAVRLDGAAIGQMSVEDKCLYVGYLPQAVELFNVSVRDNIARFTDASDEEVIAAAKLAGAHEMILQLPQGYATVLRPDGVTLSAGQRQRIGLARALFGDPRLVVLDEPNANLDSDGEQALMLALRALRERQVTVILVTQRMAVMQEVGKALVMRGGQVAAYGPTAQVLGELMRASQAARAGAPGAAQVAADPRRGGLRVMPGQKPAAGEPPPPQAGGASGGTGGT